MAGEVLTLAGMAAADAYAAAHGVPTLTLMENAGTAVAREIAARWSPRPTTILCGPGNNGGDGYVVARLLQEMGWDVQVEILAGRVETLAGAAKGDAAAMARRWKGEVLPAAGGNREAGLFVDAMFGTGLSRPLEGEARRFAVESAGFADRIVAIDVPSGLGGDTGHARGDVAVSAALTVTFFRKKPVHVLMPGRLDCGEIVVADIGIPQGAIVNPSLFENSPAFWGADFRWPDPRAHKYSRGSAVVVSGPAHATGAARLAARGALRIGAGLVSVASPPDALGVNAASLTAIMVKPFSGAGQGAGGLGDLLADKRFNAVAVGPGCGVGEATRALVRAALASGAAVVVDADALTSFADEPRALFDLLRGHNAVITPHAGEFERIFPGLLDKSTNRIEAARTAAGMAGCTVLLKGPDTVIAAPPSGREDGRAVVNTNAPAELATAGAGDVLAGFITGLLAQGMDPLGAAAAGAWLHGEAAMRFGPGLIAEDLPEMLPRVLADLRRSLTSSHPGKPLL